MFVNLCLTAKAYIIFSIGLFEELMIADYELVFVFFPTTLTCKIEGLALVFALPLFIICLVIVVIHYWLVWGLIFFTSFSIHTMIACYSLLLSHHSLPYLPYFHVLSYPHNSHYINCSYCNYQHTPIFSSAYEFLFLFDIDFE